MRSILWKSCLGALMAALVMTAAPVEAGTATFNITGGSVSGTTATATFSNVTTLGLSPLAPDGTFPISGGGIQVDLTTLALTISGVAPSPFNAFSLAGTLDAPITTGPTSGFGSVSFTSPTQAQAFLSYSYNVTMSGNELTGGTFTLSTQAVPEPSSLAMGASALVGLALAASRRRAKARA